MILMILKLEVGAPLHYNEHCAGLDHLHIYIL